ncbi:MAG: hypothetical protein NTV55_12545 [Planctomycetota bacterium]|nr:hypothetical protein [Planctomycetota bacterium]
MSDFEIPALMEEFQAAFQPVMASVDGMKEMLGEIIPTCQDREKRQQFEEIFQSIQQQQAEVLREIPPLAAETEAEIRAGMAELKSMSGQVDALDGRLKVLDAKLVETRKGVEARRLAAGPAPLSAAAKARAHFSSLRAKLPASPAGLPLKDGDLLVRQLLAICQPKAAQPAKGLGNIWENWSEAVAKDAAEKAAQGVTKNANKDADEDTAGEDWLGNQ